MRVGVRLGLGVSLAAVVIVAGVAGYRAHREHRAHEAEARWERAHAMWDAWRLCVADPTIEPCDERPRGGCSVGESLSDLVQAEAQRLGSVREAMTLDLARHLESDAGARWLLACDALPGLTDDERAEAPDLARIWAAARAQLGAWREAGAPDDLVALRAVAQTLSVSAPTPALPQYVSAEASQEGEAPWSGYAPAAPADRGRVSDDVVFLARREGGESLVCHVGQMGPTCEAAGHDMELAVGATADRPTVFARAEGDALVLREVGTSLARSPLQIEHARAVLSFGASTVHVTRDGSLAATIESGVGQPRTRLTRATAVPGLADDALVALVPGAVVSTREAEEGLVVRVQPFELEDRRIGLGEVVTLPLPSAPRSITGDVLCPLSGGGWALTFPLRDERTAVVFWVQDGWSLHTVDAGHRVQGCVRDAVVALQSVNDMGALAISRVRCTSRGCEHDGARVASPRSEAVVRVVDLGDVVAVLTQTPGGPLRARIAPMSSLAGTASVVASIDPHLAMGEVIARDGRALVLDARRVAVHVVDAHAPALTLCAEDE